MPEDLGALSGSREPDPCCTGSGPSGFDPARLSGAIAVAAQAHANQCDKGGAPYILHPLRVMFAVEKHGEDAMIAAVLHDVVEDCGISLCSIAAQFGPAVSKAVDALSRREGEPYSEFIERCGQNELANIIKREDLSDNSRVDRLPRITTKDWARIDKYSRAHERLHAIATEAHRAETPQSGSVHEGAGRKASPKPSQGDTE